MVIPLDAPPAEYVRQPGTFKRKGPDGPPYVKSLTKTKQRTGRKAELIEQCNARGIPVPPKATVADLKDLLGPEPAWELYGRPSGFGDPLENQFALRKHIERGIAAGVVKLVLDGMHPNSVDLDDLDALDRLVLDAQDAVDSMIWADRGTHVHLLIERHENSETWDDLVPAGEALGIPAPLQAAIVHGWASFRAALGVRSVHRELAITNDELRIAGTADLIDVAERQIDTSLGMTIAAGQAFIADVKTGDPRDKYAVQLVGYRDGVPYDLEVDERREWGVELHANVGLIYHMSMKAVLDGAPVEWSAIPVNLAVGRDGARICCEARDWPAAPVFGAPILAASGPALEASGAADNPRTAVEQQAAVEPGDLPEPPAPAAAGELHAPAATPRRDALRQRRVRMETNAIETGWHAEFLARWQSFGITADSADDEIEAALDAIEPPFDPDPRPAVEVGASTPSSFVNHVDDGAPVRPEDVAVLVGAIQRDEHRDVVNGWLAQSRDAGRSWDPRVSLRVRQYEITRAALALATATTGDDQYVRLILATALDAPMAEAARVVVGEALSTLTIAEARRVTALAEAFGNTLHLIFAQDGTPSLSGDVWRVLEAVA